MPETGARTDPYSAFNFLVEIDGVTVAGFSECSGLTSETDAIEYRNGDTDTVLTQLSGLQKFEPIVLKRGFTDNRDLWEWRKTVIDGRTERHTGVITLLNEAREPALRFNFREGWPSIWEGPTFNAKTNEVAINTLQIKHEGVVLE
jgi:phage tail-like protein